VRFKKEVLEVSMPFLQDGGNWTWLVPSGLYSFAVMSFS